MNDEQAALIRTDVSAIAHDRDAIRATFAALPKLVLATQQELNEIKNRGFWDRLFKNNTRDLATAMEKIVEVQQATLMFVTMLISLHEENIGWLRFLREEIDRVRTDLRTVASTTEEVNKASNAVQRTLDQALDIVEAKIATAEPSWTPWLVALVVAVIGVIGWASL